MHRTSAARRIATVVAAVLTVVCAYLAVAYAIDALGPHGTWTDVLGALAFMAAGVSCGALALEGIR
jgi:hypothetical protein